MKKELGQLKSQWEEKKGETPFKYFTSKINREWSAPLVTDAAFWVKKHEATIVGVRRGGIISALLVQAAHKSFFPNEEAPEIIICDPAPLIDWKLKTPRLSSGSSQEEVQKYMEDYAEFARKTPYTGRFIERAVDGNKVNQAIAVVDNTRISGTTMDLVTGAFYRNGFENVRGFTTSPFNQIPLWMGELMHEGIPEEAVAEVEKILINPSSPETLSEAGKQLIKEIGMFSHEIWMDFMLEFLKRKGK